MRSSRVDPAPPCNGASDEDGPDRTWRRGRSMQAEARRPGTRDAPALRRRVADLGLVHAVYGAADKLAAASSLLAGIGLSWSEVAAIGDDWPDLPLLARAAFAAAPPNAHAEVRAAAHYVTTARGGQGAAREFCDLLLMASGRYAALLAAHQGTLDGR